MLSGTSSGDSEADVIGRIVLRLLSVRFSEDAVKNEISESLGVVGSG